MAEIRNRPLSYIDWIQSQALASLSESDLFDRYNEYVVDFYKAAKTKNIDNAVAIEQLYVDLLQEITLNYTSHEERRFLSQLDYTDKKELDIIVPFFVNKLKTVTQYVVKKRHQVKYTKLKYSHKGSEKGIERAVKDIIVNKIDDPHFRQQYPTAKIPAISSVVDRVTIDIEPLYDIYQYYYDSDPTVQKDSYITKNDNDFLYDKFYSNVEETKPHVWLDLRKAVEHIFEQIPLILEADNDDDVKTTSNAFLTVNVARDDIHNLYYDHFIDTRKAEDNLVIEYEKQLIQKYAGTKVCYLSTGTSTLSAVTGVLFEPEHGPQNYFNRYYSSHATVPNANLLKTLKDVGGFFTPSKLGTLNYTTLHSVYDIDIAKLEPDTIYVYPDPDEYGVGRGNTRTDQPSPLKHIDIVRDCKGTPADDYRHGDIANDKNMQKFYPYQSREETLQLHPAGISRSTDNVDFWSGDELDVWANEDIYRVKPFQSYPLSEKIDDLLAIDLSVHTWKTDIYGNEYALFKKTHPQRKTTEQSSDSLRGTATQNIETHTRSLSDKFGYPPTKYYNYLLSKNITVFDSTSADTLSSAVTVYDRGTSTIGNLYFRNIYSSKIDSVSAALSAVFVKYRQNTDILNEIYYDVKGFDIIKDLIIIETTNFIVLERYTYNQSTDKFSSLLPKSLYLSVSGTNKNLAKFTNIWYDDASDEVIFGKTVVASHLSGTNSKIIYPVFYKFDFQSNNLRTMFDLRILSGAPTISDNPLQQYNLLTDNEFRLIDSALEVTPGSAQYVNITNIDTPYISNNKQDHTLALTYIARDPFDTTFTLTYYFDTILTTEYSFLKADMFRPENEYFNYNLSNYTTLSSYIEAPLSRGAKENRQISFDSFVSESAPYDSTLIRGLTGRSINPSHMIDLDNGTVRMGVGPSAHWLDPDPVNVGVDHAEVSFSGTVSSPLSGDTYSHNSSYLLFNSALSAVQNDVIVSFDVAFYTNKNVNRRYAQINKHGSGWPGYF